MNLSKHKDQKSSQKTIGDQNLQNKIFRVC